MKSCWGHHQLVGSSLFVLRADISSSFFILSTNMPLRWCKKPSKYCRSGSAAIVRSLSLVARDSVTYRASPPSSRMRQERSQSAAGSRALKP